MIYDEIKRESIDWIKVIIHFLCGGILGAFIGLWIWVRTGALESWDLGIALIGGFGLALGIASGVFLDRFWGGLRDFANGDWP
jgi:hypothetical protein